MTRALRTRWYLLVLTAWFCAACGGADDTGEPVIEINGLKRSYCLGDRLAVTIQNQGKQAVSVNAAIETYDNGRWVETWSSLRAAPRQIPSKIAHTDLVQPGQSTTYSFDILSLTVRSEFANAKHRLRADGIVNTKRKSFVSPEFAICSTK